MNKSIMYENTDNTVMLLRLDLIDIIRECEFEDALTQSMREQYENLVSRIKKFSDYSSVVRILKPESKMSIDRFYELYSGLNIVPYDRHVIRYCMGTADNKEVMLLVPTYMVKTIIRRIVDRPKVIAISTSSVLNTNHWLDSCIREKFKEADTKANDFMDAISYAMKCDIDFSSMHPDPVLIKYCENDVKATQEIWGKLKEETMRPKYMIRNVIFNDPATIVFWYDGTKTVVKCQPGDTFDPEKGLAMAICKKVLGCNKSQSNFNDIFKKWLPKEEKKEPTVNSQTLAVNGG